MRVITGVAKGRKLKAPKGMDTRPTTDRTKEALFNIIGERVIDAVVLDLFAGTGAIGIEAISRGAARVFFVENNRQAVSIIKDNLSVTGFFGNAEVLPMDAMKALDKLTDMGTIFDLVYIDPPYLKDLEKKCLQVISEYNLVSNEGIVITESSKLDSMPDNIGKFEMFRQEKYGDTILTFYQKVNVLEV